jgi:hypothetical protein
MGRDDGGDTLGQCEEQATQPLQFGETGGGGGGGRAPGWVTLLSTRMK